MRVGWIGTGIMGAHMCSHILRAGHDVCVHTRTRAKASLLESLGAGWCDTAADVAASSDIVFTMVGYPHEVENLYLKAGGLLDKARRGTVFVDMTTSSPSLAKDVYHAARGRGCLSLDAPVSGGDTGARQATLAIMAGGDRKTYEKVLPLLNLLGRTVRLMGGPGAGQHTKMANQTAIATTMIGVVESILYARHAGLDPQAVIDVISRGAASSWSLDVLGRRILADDLAPGFFIRHFIKDMGIALEEARRMNLSLPGLALAHQFYVAAAAMGLEDLGTQALVKVFERMSGR